MCQQIIRVIFIVNFRVECDGMLKMWLCDFEHYHDQHSCTLSVCAMHAVCNESGSSVYCCINVLLL